MESRRYTSGYLRTNRHFVLQNLPPRRECDGWTPLLKVALNLLQRGSPTPVPAGLKSALVAKQDEAECLDALLSLPDKPPVWRHTIRGYDKAARFPAQDFFDRHLLDALGENSAALWLVQPETLVTDILGNDHEIYREQQVDFYVPDAGLVIEIDGKQHDLPGQARKDLERVQFLKRYGIRTERITARQITDPQQCRACAQHVAEQILASPRVKAVLSANRVASPNKRPAEQLIAAFRLQVTGIEMLLRGQLDPTAPEWRIQIRTDIAPTFVRPALEDLCALIAPLASLVNTKWEPPALLTRIIPLAAEVDPSLPTVDLSIARRWTDENVDEPHVVYCRSDYIHQVPGEGGEWIESDQFQVEHGAPITYEIREEAARPHFRSLLARLFGFEDFRDGQWPIVESVLRRYSSIGVLPTGGGKSLCYQLPALLQPGLTLVVSPIKSLMRDQVAELFGFGIGRVSAVTSEDSAKEKARKLNSFAAGRTQILLVSPERFQVSTFRDACAGADKHFSVHHVVVDEVHCLSEWGHDFRTAYLNLGNAFRRVLPKSSVVGLTATASQNALTDIQLEFNIPDQQVFYRLDLKRPNLHFQVIPIDGSHSSTAIDWVSQKLDVSGGMAGAGIIFTPHVNGALGCQEMAQRLEERCKLEVGVFSGSKPKAFKGTDSQFDIQKQTTQDRFKAGDLKIICATKAFGMGVNKRNVRFTLHLGIPASMEALYQEAGRAGRDGEGADCIVLSSPPDPALAPALTPDIRPPDLKALVDGSNRQSDLRIQLWLLTKALGSLADETKLLSQVLNSLEAAQCGSTQLSAHDFGVDAHTLEKSIYRLAQIGYVADWTVEDYFAGRYLVDFAPRSDEEVEIAILELAQKYSGRSEEKASLEALCTNDEDAYQVIFHSPTRSRRNRNLLLLCYWCYRHFNYARRQSMKSVFDLCYEYSEIGEAAFRNRLEGFFAINTSTIVLRQFIETGIERIDDWRQLLDPPHLEGRLGAAGRQNHLEQLRGMITRLLESYESNVALDSFSAAVRILLNQYNDPDGTGRLVRQLNRHKDNPGTRNKVCEFILDVASAADGASRELVARDILNCYPGREMALMVHSKLRDTLSASHYFSELQLQLQSLNRRIEHGLAGR